MTQTDRTEKTEVYQPRVGDLERVILPGDDVDCDDCPHFLDEVGHTGRIIQRTVSAGTNSHPFLVMFTTPCTVESRFSRALILPARHYAASELQQIRPTVWYDRPRSA